MSNSSGDILILIIRNPLISLILLLVCIIFIFSVMWYLSNYEYNRAEKSLHKSLKCGFYQGIIREEGRTNLHKDYFYRSIVFDGEQYPSRINSFNFGKNKFYKQQLKNVENGDRVCLVISNDVVTEFNIQN